MEWIDAMRGFTMILVVAYHVNYHGFGHMWYYSPSQSMFMLFRMPLFFFISGFLAYRASQVWTTGELGRLLLKKLRVQVVPTLVFFTLYIMAFHHDWPSAWWDSWNAPTKAGYWFTIALLYMFVVYYVFAFIESKLRLRSWIPIALLFVVALVLYETCYMPRHFSWALGYRGQENELIVNSSLRQAMINFPYFVLGNIFHRYWQQAQRFLEAKWLLPLLVVVFVVSALDFFRWQALRMEWRNLSQTLARYSLLLIVFMSFRYYQNHFSKATRLGHVLQFIGRRTLDIYLLHFFLLPDMHEIGVYFKAHPHNFVADTTLSVAVALIIIAFCLVASAVLRVSPVLKKWLFGR